MNKNNTILKIKTDEQKSRKRQPKKNVKKSFKLGLQKEYSSGLKLRMIKAVKIMETIKPAQTSFGPSFPFEVWEKHNLLWH